MVSAGSEIQFNQQDQQHGHWPAMFALDSTVMLLSRSRDSLLIAEQGSHTSMIHRPSIAAYGQLAKQLPSALTDGYCATALILQAAGKRGLTDWQSPVGFFTDKTAYGCPKDLLFNNPWVKENIAVTYGLQIRDGLGSQTARMLGVYAIAHAVGIHYVHSPFQCIGHIGGAPHYRNMRCDYLPPTDMQRLQRISQHIHLPSTTAADVSTWDSVYIFRGDWVSLANAAAVALANKRPTLIKLELVDEFISVCPDIFYHVEAWRPSILPDNSVSSREQSHNITA